MSYTMIFLHLSAAATIIIAGKKKSINFEEMYVKNRREQITSRRLGRFERIAIIITNTVLQAETPTGSLSFHAPVLWCAGSF